ncbi:MAG: hypothetical protein HY718_03660 [Planctomycetes bacterium]|nr:hypothetical protein [Planctomycetota bacterium]
MLLYAPMYNSIRDQIVCANGAIDLDIYSGRFMEGIDPDKVKWQAVERPDWDKNPPKVRALNTWRRAEWASYKDFFACIREGRPPLCDAAMAREFGLTTMMIRRAMRERRPVTWNEMQPAS